MAGKNVVAITIIVSTVKASQGNKFSAAFE
jgi:hypothetical protein